MDSRRSTFKVSPVTARFDNKQPGLADRTHCHHSVTSFQPVDVGRIERQNSSINMRWRSRIQYLILELDFAFAWEVLRGALATGIQCTKCKSHRHVVFAHSPAWRSHQSNIVKWFFEEKWSSKLASLGSCDSPMTPGPPANQMGRTWVTESVNPVTCRYLRPQMATRRLSMSFEAIVLSRGHWSVSDTTTTASGNGREAAGEISDVGYCTF